MTELGCESIVMTVYLAILNNIYSYAASATPVGQLDTVKLELLICLLNNACTVLIPNKKKLNECTIAY